MSTLSRAHLAYVGASEESNGPESVENGRVFPKKPTVSLCSITSSNNVIETLMLMVTTVLKLKWDMQPSSSYWCRKMTSSAWLSSGNVCFYGWEKWFCYFKNALQTRGPILNLKQDNCAWQTMKMSLMLCWVSNELFICFNGIRLVKI